MTGKDQGNRPDAATERKQDWIASQLRRVFNEALQEEIPADMLALLSKLDEAAEEEKKAP